MRITSSPDGGRDSQKSGATALFLFLAFIAAVASCSITQNPFPGLLIMGGAIGLSIVFNILLEWRRKKLQERAMKEAEEIAQKMVPANKEYF